MKPAFRKARLNDAPSLAAIHVNAWHTAFKDLVPDSFLRTFTIERRTEVFYQFLTSDSDSTFVAATGREIVGFLNLGPGRDLDIDGAITGEIWGIYIDPAHWRQGVGKFLCHRAEAIFAENRVSVVKLWVLAQNDRARQFYDSVGYVPDGTSKDVDLGTPLQSVRYEKRLSAF